ncbi:MAG: hypothetical protein WC341_12240 [Bacteroidales bacterium]
MYSDITGKFVSTIIGAITGALAGALTALVTGGDFWANVGYGALTGALAGLVVDISVATAGVGTGLLIAGIGGAAVGFGGDVFSQKLLEGKSWEEIDYGRSATVAIICGLVNLASLGIGRALLSGTELTGNIFQKVSHSFLQSGYGDWIAQGIFALSFCSLPTIPTWITPAKDEIPAGVIIFDQYAFGR